MSGPPLFLLQLRMLRKVFFDSLRTNGQLFAYESSLSLGLSKSGFCGVRKIARVERAGWLAGVIFETKKAPAFQPGLLSCIAVVGN